jgi:hypothetical protein
MGQARNRKRRLGPAYGQPPAMAWHYTLGRKIPRILRDGALRDAWMERNRKESGALTPYSIWLTTATTVDPTSCAALTQRGSYAGDAEAFKRMTGGHWRIGFELPHPALMTYREALILHPPSDLMGAYYRSLAPMGENRNQWRMAGEPLPLIGCRIEEQQGGEWITHPLGTLSRDDSGPGYGLPGLHETDVAMPSSGSFRDLPQLAQEAYETAKRLQQEAAA